MRRIQFSTFDVFTTARFGGNQLAVFPDADGIDDALMQSLAAEMNYSETTFVLSPKDPANTARVRIFNRTAEMPFAGHPNVGTGYALAMLGRAGSGDTMRFEEVAGLVEVRLKRRADGTAVGAEIDAPQPLQLFDELSADAISACIGLAPHEVSVNAHRPVRASVGVDFVLVEVEASAISRAAPDLQAFRRSALAAGAGDRLSILAYSRDGNRIHARMFAPLAGTWEDPATGSANAALGALLLSKTNLPDIALEVVQGVEMGRPSALSVRAYRAADGLRASVGGSCVPVFRGEIEL